MNRCAIWTGDTTTHGGILNEGHVNFTFENKNRAVLVGHKFWCPKCLCWSTFIEGCLRQNVHGSLRVMQGHLATCGAMAIHTLGRSDVCVCDCGSAAEKKREAEIEIRKAVHQNQKDGGYSHTFRIHHNEDISIKYLVFSDTTPLDMGTARMGLYGGSSPTKIKTEECKAINIAIQAPRPRLK